MVNSKKDGRRAFSIETSISWEPDYAGSRIEFRMNYIVAGRNRIPTTGYIMDFIDELKWRGMIHDITPGTQEMLQKGAITGYAGFDPTAKSLQIGNLAAIMLLVHFQRAGHKPIALVGGATGLIGDPSGRSEERQLMSADEVQANLEKFKKQLKRFLDFDCGAQSAEIVNNYDWFRDVGYLNFLRDVGKHLTVGYMIAKDSVQQRLGAGISYTEFSYQLLQAYDFYWLNINKKCVLQIGGSDQWGNITSGIELIRRMAGIEACAVTCPLVTRADGTKFGKSASGESLWLDPQMTSPYKFYQFWLNCTDDDAARFIRIFSLLSQEEIAEVEAAHAKAPNERHVQKALARDITARVHSERDYRQAVQASKILFGAATTQTLQELDEKSLLDVFEGVPASTIARTKLEAGIAIVELLVGIGIFGSKGEARRMIRNGGVNINKVKIVAEDEVVGANRLLSGKYLLVQKGKKNYHLVVTC
jgi:tyrosyl-tRNA synthetase